MYQPLPRQQRRRRIHRRIRKRFSGGPERPRLAVFRSSKHIYAQVIDDAKGHTLASAASTEKDMSGYGGNVAAAKLVGEKLAQRAVKAGVKRVIFDRGGHLYHGRVKSLADAAREGGLEF